MKTYPDITLSTGRIIHHERHHAGYQVATPTTGSYEMTNDEWREYTKILNTMPSIPNCNSVLTS